MNILTATSRVVAGRLVGVNCPCGGSAGKSVDGLPVWYCDGFRGAYDTYICTHECHSRADLIERVEAARAPQGPAEEPPDA